MRLTLALLLAVVVVAVPSVMTLTRGDRGKNQGAVVGDSTVKEVINQENDSQTTEEVTVDAGDSGVETLDKPEEGVLCEREACDPEEVEAAVERDAKENQESGQDIQEGSELAERNAVVDESDSSEESSNEEETVTSSEATEDHDCQDEVPVNVSKKSKGRILENFRASATSKSKPTPKENVDSTDSPLEKRETEVPSGNLPEEENYEVLVRAEPLTDDLKKDTKTSDLEIAQSEINEIIFGKEEKSVEEVDTQVGTDDSDTETDDTHNEEIHTIEAFTDHQSGVSLIKKRTAPVEESPEDREIVHTDKPRILSPAEFFGHFEDDSAPVTDEDDSAPVTDEDDSAPVTDEDDSAPVTDEDDSALVTDEND